MVKETSTLDSKRPTILDEKRRIERELGLPEEPPVVLPRSNRPGGPRVGLSRRIAAWLKGPAR
jgi:hypothetical protein